MIIPRAGDIWEVKLPGKSKKQKEIGNVRLAWMQKEDGSQVRRPYIDWARLPKGRYTGIRVKCLLKYGRRVSTKVERDMRFQAMIDRRKAERKLKKLTTN